MAFNEINAIEIKKYHNIFIYFLLKNEEVVYIGQTTQGISRPLSHKDKEYDTIKIIYCKENELDLLEDKYISKYKPLHNKCLDYSMYYSLLRARNKIRQCLGIKDFNIPDLKGIIKELSINLSEFNRKKYLEPLDVEKVINYIKG